MKAFIPVLLAVACDLAVAQTSVGIALRPQARVTGPLVTLGDIAVLTANELEPLRTLVNLPLGRTPGAGEALVIQREAVAAWVRAKSGKLHESLHWSGPASTQLLAAVRRVRGEDIAACAEAALRAWLAARASGGDEGPQLQSLPRDLEAPDGELRLRARSLDGATPHSRMLVWVDVWVDQRFVRTVAVPFHVPLELPSLPHGSAIHGSTANSLLVQRGQWASLRSGSGAVSLEARVEVLQDGRLGDSVRVRQPGAAAGVIARVTGPAQLELAR